MILRGDTHLVPLKVASALPAIISILLYGAFCFAFISYPCSFEQGHPNPPRPVLSMPQALSPPYLLGVNLFWNAALIDPSFVGLYHTSTKLDLIKSKNLHLVGSLTFVTTENYLLLCVFLLIPLNANDSYSSRMQKYANIFDVLQFNKSSFLSLFFFRMHS